MCTDISHIHTQLIFFNCAFILFYFFFFNFWSKYIILLKISKIQYFLPLNVEIYIFFPNDIFKRRDFFFHEHAFIPPKIGKIWIFCLADAFINEQFFAQILFFHPLSAKFVTNYQNMNFSWDWYFKNGDFVCVNKLLLGSFFAKR